MFNALAFLALLLVNCIPIWYSHKRRRFAWFSTKIFAVFFIVYWAWMLLYFQSFGFLTFSGTSRSFPNPGNSKYESVYALKSDYENETIAQLRKMSFELRLTIMQAIIVILLSIFGILWLNEKVDYYTRVILIFIPLLAFCIFIYQTGLMRKGYETIIIH